MKILICVLSAIMLLLSSCRESVVNEAVDKPEGKIALASWADAPRQRIEGWVHDVTDSSSRNFIPVSDRIAVFDNDGTLWPEQPVPSQIVFAIENLRAIAPAHPEFNKDPLLKSLIAGDLEPLKKAGMEGLVKVTAASHFGQSADTFNASVRNWVDTAIDPRFGKRYKDVTYLPMTELLTYLRDNGFKTFIVSGGGADFMRVWSEEAYGIPPYQVVGSYGALSYALKDGKPVITKQSGELFADDKEGKPVAIHRFIGKVPVFCGGNSDGDQAMMQYTHGSRYKSMNLIVHHTDSMREYKYDKDTHSGRLETALVEANEKNWLVVDMSKDWKKIFSFELP